MKEYDDELDEVADMPGNTTGAEESTESTKVASIKPNGLSRLQLKLNRTPLPQKYSYLFFVSYADETFLQAPNQAAETVKKNNPFHPVLNSINQSINNLLHLIGAPQNEHQQFSVRFSWDASDHIDLHLDLDQSPASLKEKQHGWHVSPPGIGIQKFWPHHFPVNFWVSSSLSSTSQEHLSHPFFQRLITLLFSPHSYTPYKPTDFLACSTPNSSIPSTGVSATPNTTIDVDSRATTPKGDGKEDEEEVVIDDAHKFCSRLIPASLAPGKNMKIMVGFKIFTDSKNQKKVRIHLPVNSSGHFPVNIKVGETDFPQFRNVVALACSDHFAKTGPVILNLKTVLWWGSIPHVTDWKKANKNEVNTPSGYAVWLNTACQAKKKSIGLDIKMPDPGAAKKKAAKEDLLAKQEAQAAAIKESASKKRKSASGGLGGGTVMKKGNRTVWCSNSY
ncbi:hypothetical protein KEM48_011205 [Puccinia striiformis f. sp. tritici PST-130]|nr:hypothetical protein KEM48_011205 [Puccinia striiformis f. sp. tritici PST-130]